LYLSCHASDDVVQYQYPIAADRSLTSARERAMFSELEQWMMIPTIVFTLLTLIARTSCTHPLLHHSPRWNAYR
jgi:hypothetical protein